MTTAFRGSPRRRALAVVVLGLLLAAVLAGTGALDGGARVASASPSERPDRRAVLSQGGVTVKADPTTLLTDGQSVAMNVKTTADVPVYSAEARVCRAGVTYQVSSEARPNDDFKANGANCPLNAVSSSGDAVAVDNSMFTFAPTPEGETFALRVGLGVVAWKDGVEDRLLTCDATNACSLVVQLLMGAGVPSWTPFVFPLTYQLNDPIAACGGVAPSVLATGGSDRMADAWVQWTLGSCRRAGSSGAPSRASFTGEGLATSSFAAGGIDLAYTAAGYDDTVGLVPADIIPPADRRAMTPVPVAVNATVLALANGIPGNNGKKVPYRDVKLTLQEAAALLGGGTYGIEPYLDTILARNPELKKAGMFQTGTQFQVGAASTEDATTWFQTHHVDALRPNDWKVPSLPGVFGAEAGRARGSDVDYATAVPSYQSSLSLYTGRPALQRNVTGLAEFGGVWVFTDLVTARSLGMTPVQLENAAGAFVAPTPENMVAAVTKMRPGADGMLLPDPNAVAAAGEVQPYPLTHVEYALAPTEPLVDETCQPRTGSQALLADWLGYITGAGQQLLPAGFEPLTPSLAVQAHANRAKVGASPLTGECAEQPTDPEPETALPPEVPDIRGTDDAVDLSGFGDDTDLSSSADLGADGSGDGTDAGATGADTSAGSADVDGGAPPPGDTVGTTAPSDGAAIQLAASGVTLPDYAGGGTGGNLGAAVALVALAALLSMAAFATAGRRVPEAA